MPANEHVLSYLHVNHAQVDTWTQATGTLVIKNPDGTADVTVDCSAEASQVTVTAVAVTGTSKSQDTYFYVGEPGTIHYAITNSAYIFTSTSVEGMTCTNGSISYYIANSGRDLYITVTPNATAASSGCEVDDVATDWAPSSISTTANDCTISPASRSSTIVGQNYTFNVTPNWGYYLEGDNQMHRGVSGSSGLIITDPHPMDDYDAGSTLALEAKCSSSIDGVLTVSCRGRTFTLVYDDNGATSGSAPASTTATYSGAGSVITVSQISGMAKEGYVGKAYWNTAADGSGTNIYPGNISINNSLFSGATTTSGYCTVRLYAQWEELHPVIQYSLWNCTGAPSNPTTIDFGGTASISIIANTGYSLPSSSSQNFIVTGATVDSWNASTGALTISNPRVETVYINITASKATYTLSASMPNHITANIAGSMQYGDTKTVTIGLVSHTGYTEYDNTTRHLLLELPDSLISFHSLSGTGWYEEVEDPDDPEHRYIYSLRNITGLYSGYSYNDEDPGQQPIETTNGSYQKHGPFYLTSTATCSISPSSGLFVGNTFTISNVSSNGTITINEGACMLAGTKILMADGTEKLIEDVKANDLVMAINPFTNELITTKVVINQLEETVTSYNAVKTSKGILNLTNKHGIYNKDLHHFSDYSDAKKTPFFSLDKDGKEVKISKVTAKTTDIPTNTYVLTTTIGLYFANGVLCGHRASQKYARVGARMDTFPNAVKMGWLIEYKRYMRAITVKTTPEYIQLETEYKSNRTILNKIALDEFMKVGIDIKELAPKDKKGNPKLLKTMTEEYEKLEAKPESLTEAYNNRLALETTWDTALSKLMGVNDHKNWTAELFKNCFERDMEKASIVDAIDFSKI